MLNDLTPDEQRARIEGWLRTYAGCIGPDYFAAQNIEFLCRLALRGLPKVEWWEIIPNFEWQAEFGEWELAAYKGKKEAEWKWELGVLGAALLKRSAPTLEAAKTAAEAALLKLIGGGE